MAAAVMALSVWGGVSVEGAGEVAAVQTLYAGSNPRYFGPSLPIRRTPPLLTWQASATPPPTSSRNTTPPAPVAGLV